MLLLLVMALSLALHHFGCEVAEAAATDVHLSCDDHIIDIFNSGVYILNCSDPRNVRISGCVDGGGVGASDQRSVRVKAYSVFGPVSVTDAGPDGSSNAVAGCSVEITILYNITSDDEDGTRDTIGVYSPVQHVSVVVMSSVSTSSVPLLKIAVGGRVETLLFVAVGDVKQGLVVATGSVASARIHIFGNVDVTQQPSMFSFDSCSQFELVINGSSAIHLSNSVLVKVSHSSGVDAASIAISGAAIALDGASSLVHVQTIHNCLFFVRRCIVAYTTASTLLEVQDFRNGFAENSTFILEDSVFNGEATTTNNPSPLFDVETCVDPVVVGLDNTTLTISGTAQASSPLILVLDCSRNTQLLVASPPSTTSITTAFLINATIDTSRIQIAQGGNPVVVAVVSFWPPLYTSLHILSSTITGNPDTQSLYVLGNYETNTSRSDEALGFTLVLANTTFLDCRYILSLERPSPCQSTNQFLSMQCDGNGGDASTWCRSIFDIKHCDPLQASHIRQAPPNADPYCPLTVVNTTNAANVCSAWSAAVAARRRRFDGGYTSWYVVAQPSTASAGGAAATNGYEFGVAGRWLFAPIGAPTTGQHEQRLVGCLPSVYGSVVVEVLVADADRFAFVAGAVGLGVASAFPTTTMQYCSLMVTFVPSRGSSSSPESTFHIVRPLINVSGFPLQHLHVSMNGVNLTTSGADVVALYDPLPAASLHVALLNKTSVSFFDDGTDGLAVLRLVGPRGSSSTSTAPRTVRVVVTDSTIRTATARPLRLIYDEVKTTLVSSGSSTLLEVAHSTVMGTTCDLVALLGIADNIRNVTVRLTAMVVNMTSAFHIVESLIASHIAGLVVDVYGGSLRSGGALTLVRGLGVVAVDALTIDGTVIHRVDSSQDALLVHATSSGSTLSSLTVVGAHVACSLYTATAPLVAVAQPLEVKLFLSNSLFENIGCVWRNPSLFPLTNPVVIGLDGCTNLWCTTSTASNEVGASSTCIALNASTTPTSVWYTGLGGLPVIEMRSNASCAVDGAPIALPCSDSKNADSQTTTILNAGVYTVNCTLPVTLVVADCSQAGGDASGGGGGTVNITARTPLHSIVIVGDSSSGTGGTQRALCAVSITILGETWQRTEDEMGVVHMKSYGVVVGRRLRSLDVTVNTTLFVGSGLLNLVKIAPLREEDTYVSIQSLTLRVLSNATVVCVDGGNNFNSGSRCSVENAFSFVQILRSHTVEPFFTIANLTIHVDRLTVRNGFPVALVSVTNGNALLRLQPAALKLHVDVGGVDGLWTRSLFVAAFAHIDGAEPDTFVLGDSTSIVARQCVFDIATSFTATAVTDTTMTSKWLLQAAAPADMVLLSVDLQATRIAGGCLNISTTSQGSNRSSVAAVLTLHVLQSNVTIANGSLLHHHHNHQPTAANSSGCPVVSLRIKDSRIVLSGSGSGQQGSTAAVVSRSSSGGLCTDTNRAVQGSHGGSGAAALLMDNATVVLMHANSFVWYERLLSQGSGSAGGVGIVSGINVSLHRTAIVAITRRATQPLLMWVCSDGGGSSACSMANSVILFEQCNVVVGVVVTAISSTTPACLVAGVGAMLSTDVLLDSTVVNISVQPPTTVFPPGAPTPSLNASLLHIDSMASTSTIQLHNTTASVNVAAIADDDAIMLFFVVELTDRSGGGGKIVVKDSACIGLHRMIGLSTTPLAHTTSPPLQVSLVGCNNVWCTQLTAPNPTTVCRLMTERNVAAAPTASIDIDRQRCATPTATASNDAPTVSTSNGASRSLAATMTRAMSHHSLSLTLSIPLLPPQFVAAAMSTAVQAAAVALVAPAGGAVLATSVAGLVQRSVLGIRYSACGTSDGENGGYDPPIPGSYMPVMEHPTRLAFGPLRGAMFRGAIVGNIVLLLACALATGLYGTLRAYKSDDAHVRCMDVLATARMPGRLFVVYAVLLQPTITAAAALVVDGASAGDHVLGGAGLLVMVVPLVAAAVVVHIGCSTMVRAVARPVDASHVVLDRIVGRRVEWVPRSEGGPKGKTIAFASQSSFARNYDTLMGKMRSDRHLFFVVGFAWSICTGVVGVLDASVEASCHAAQACLLTISALSLASFLVLRPFASVVDLIVNVVLEILSCVMSVLSVSGAGEAAAQGISFAQISIAGAMTILRLAGHAALMLQTTKAGSGNRQAHTTSVVGAEVSTKWVDDSGTNETTVGMVQCEGQRHRPMYCRLRQHHSLTLPSAVPTRLETLQRIVEVAPWQEARTLASRNGCGDAELQAAITSLQSLVDEAHLLQARHERLSDGARRRRLMSLVSACIVLGNCRRPQEGGARDSLL